MKTQVRVCINCKQDKVYGCKLFDEKEKIEFECRKNGCVCVCYYSCKLRKNLDNYDQTSGLCFLCYVKKKFARRT